MNKTKLIAVVAGVLCISLVASLVYVNNQYTLMLEGKDRDIDDLHEIETILISERDEARSRSEELSFEVQRYMNLTQELQGIIDALNKTNADLRDVLVGGDSGLETIIFHVCEKGETSDFGRLPNATYVLNQIKNLTDSYEVLFLPEYVGNLNWTETYAWLLEKFGNEEIVLSTFEGGEDEFPNVMLEITQLSQAVQTLNVKMLRIAEIQRFYMNISQPLPVEWIGEVLYFARTNNLGVVWSEWKLGADVYPNVTRAIEGFEDIVTFTFQTNDEYHEPFEGYLDASNTFVHWGASVQPWYYVDHDLGDLMDMPPMLMVEHLVQALNRGAEIVQFEPYWYFFDNYGEPYEAFNLLKKVFSTAAINS